MQADAVPIKYRIAGETVAFLQQPCRRNRTQTIRAMLLDGRQAASDLQGMNGKTDSDQFAAESERVSLADWARTSLELPESQPHRRHEWQPKRLYAAFIPVD